MISAAVLCLAMNIFFEARSEPIEGQYAVALVTMNRVAESKKDVCHVVFYPHQFSWTIEAADKRGRLRAQYKRMLKGDAWKLSLNIAEVVFNGRIHDFTRGANYFYADYIPAPSWVKTAMFRGKFGHHYFYYKEYKE